MEDKYDYQKHNDAVNKYQLAIELAEKGGLSQAIETIKEADSLFCEVDNRLMCFKCKSYKFKWLYSENPLIFYEENEKEVVKVLEDYNDFCSNPFYIVIEYNYLSHQAKKFASAGDFINSRDALRGLLELVLNNRSALPFPVSNNLIQIWRVQIKARDAQASSARRDALITQAQYYLEAANLSTPIDDGDELASEMRRYKYDLLSTYHKLFAFSLLHRNKHIDFAKLVDNMKKSLEYAEKAYDLSREEHRKKHITYISYWLNVLSARNESIKNQFENAIKYLNQAIKDAEFFQAKCINLFPNHYADFDDLCNERLFVRAHQLLDEGDFRGSLLKLEKWFKNNKLPRGSWRYNTIKLRFLAVQLLMNLNVGFGGESKLKLGSYQISARALQQKINTLFKEISLGNASEKMAEIAVLAALDFERRELTVDGFGKVYEEINRLFPTDSVIENYEGIASISLVERHDPLEHLPECFSKELRRIQALKDIQIAIQALDNLLKCYTLIAVEYRYLKYLNYAQSDRVIPLPQDFDKHFERMTLEQLIEKLIMLTDAFRKNNDLLDYLKQYLSVRRSTEDMKDVTGLLEKAKEAITKTSPPFFPHIIRVLGEPRESEQKDETLRENYICKRIWKKEWPLELLFDADWPLQQGRFYYLRAKWKNLNVEKVPMYTPKFEIYESRLYEVIEENLQQQDEIERQKNLTWRLPDFEEKIKKLQDLIQKNETESEIGKFLTENHWVFGKGYKTFIREARIDLKNRSDYYLVTSRDERVIVEIKRPGARLFEIVKEPSATLVFAGSPTLCESKELTMAINQLREYQDAWKEQAFLEFGRHGLSYAPKAILLIGNTEDDTEKEKLRRIKEEEKRNSREIMTYDDLLSEAKGIIGLLRELLEQK